MSTDPACRDVDSKYWQSGDSSVGQGLADFPVRQGAPESDRARPSLQLIRLTQSRTGLRSLLQIASPDLRGQVMSERAFRLLAHQREPGSLVYPPGTDEDVVGRQHDPLVAGLAGEAQHLIDEPAADAEAASPAFDQQHPQSCGRGVL